MSVADLEQTLRDLPRLGTLVKDRGYRQVWRFEHAGRAYYLKFYPREGIRDRIRRAFRGSPALAEFSRLQKLQAAKIPAPAPVATLIGFRLGQRVGDAVILSAIEPSVQLDQYFNELELAAKPIPHRLDIARQIRAILRQLATARLGHEDLHLGNFLLKDGKVFLLDGYAVRAGGLTLSHLLMLGHSVGRYATRTDLQRGWYELSSGGPLPRRNALSAKLVGDLLGRSFGENRYFGRIIHENWAGNFFKLEKFPRRWSAASQLQPTIEDWNRELPRLLQQIEADELSILKRSKSGDVLTADVTLGGTTLPVIIKRPRKRYWYRYLNEIGRGSRARRAWIKAWKIIGRNLPTAYPLLYVEQRKLGYITDALIIFERVPGPTLARVELDALAPGDREMLFRRIGRILRRIDQSGLAHFDAKASNWIVRPDEKLGPSPVMIDIDGIRERRWLALGIQRLLKSLLEVNKQYSIPDSLALCQGYSPTSKSNGKTRGGKGEAVVIQADSGNNSTGPHGSAPANEMDLPASKAE